MRCCMACITQPLIITCAAWCAMNHTRLHVAIHRKHCSTSPASLYKIHRLRPVPAVTSLSKPAQRSSNRRHAPRPPVTPHLRSAAPGPAPAQGAPQTPLSWGDRPCASCASSQRHCQGLFLRLLSASGPQSRCSLNIIMLYRLHAAQERLHNVSGANHRHLQSVIRNESICRGFTVLRWQKQLSSDAPKPLPRQTVKEGLPQQGFF